MSFAQVHAQRRGEGPSRQEDVGKSRGSVIQGGGLADAFEQVVGHEPHVKPAGVSLGDEGIAVFGKDRRALSDIGSKTELLLSIDELAELLDVTFANYNGSPHDGLGGRSPLEAMEYHVRDRRTPLRTLSEPYRHNQLLLQPAHISVVRGNLRRGVRPYINLFGVRYSSAVLGEATKHIGQSIRIHFDPDDMRFVMTNFCQWC